MPKRKELNKQDVPLGTISISRQKDGLKIRIERSNILQKFLEDKGRLKKSSSIFGEKEGKFWALSSEHVLGNINGEIISNYNKRLNLSIFRLEKQTETIYCDRLLKKNDIKSLLIKLRKDIYNFYTEFMKPINIKAQIEIEEGA